MADGDLRWDVQDLDQWIDRLKAGGNDDDESIIARLI